MSSRSFNPVSGSLEGLAVFLAVAISLVVGLILSQGQIKKSSKLSIKLIPEFYKKKNSK